jgi:hypothetical protein
MLPQTGLPTVVAFHRPQRLARIAPVLPAVMIERFGSDFKDAQLPTPRLRELL